MDIIDFSEKEALWRNIAEFGKRKFVSFNSFQELTYREYESACEQSKKCESLVLTARTTCVRECISPSCYREMYEFDEVSARREYIYFFIFKGVMLIAQVVTSNFSWKKAKSMFGCCHSKDASPSELVAHEIEKYLRKYTQFVKQK